MENPYRNNSSPEVRETIIVFCDVLGTRKEVKNAHQRGCSNTLLQTLQKAINRGYRHFAPQAIEQRVAISFQPTIRGFSDNFAISTPINAGADSIRSVDPDGVQMWLLLLSASAFQLDLACSGFFLRGSVAVGEYYVDDIMVFGKALIDAYDSENDDAEVPRIIFSESTQSYIAAYARDNLELWIQDVIWVDPHGCLFVNYLNEMVDIQNSLSPQLDTMMAHKAAIARNLRRFGHCEKIGRKYRWVADYHNAFCNYHNHHFDKKFLIDARTESFRPVTYDDFVS